MADEQEKLVVAVEARVTSFERDLARVTAGLDKTRRSHYALSQEVKRGNREMQTAFQQLSNTMGAGGLLGGARGLLGLTGLGGLVGAAGIGAALQGAKAIISAVADLADEAESLQLSTDTIQAFKVLGEEAGVGGEKAAQALQKFTQASEEAARGEGALIEALRRYAPAAAEQFRAAEGQEARLRALAVAFTSVEDAAQRAEIGAAAFGARGGGKLAAGIAAANGQIDVYIQKLKDSGQILDEEAIKKADELDIAFARVARTIDGQLKTAIVGVAAVLKAMADSATRPLVTQLSATVDENLAAVEHDLERLQTELSNLGNTPAFDYQRSGLQSQIAALQEERVKLQAELGRMFRLSEGQPIPGAPGSPASVPIPRSKAPLSFAETDAILAEQRRLADASKSATDGAKTSLDNYASAAAAAKAQLEAMKASQEKFAESQRASNEYLLTFADGIATQGQSAREALEAVLRQMTSDLLRFAIVGNGAFASIFGGQTSGSGFGGLIANLLGLGGGTSTPLATNANPLSFGGPRAAGGPVFPGRVYPVGERGPEIFVPRVAGMISPQGSGGGGGGVQVTVHNYAPGSKAEVKESRTAFGMPKLDIIIRAMKSELKNDIAQRGDFARTLETHTTVQRRK